MTNITFDNLYLTDKKRFNIEFSDITFYVKYGFRKIEKKQVLKGLNGNFNSGELTAIMGPSGSGKSSLLNILTGYQKTGMGGSIRISGGGKYDELTGVHKKLSCYIMQDDHINPLFTVVEIMIMAADLKLSSSMPLKNKQLMVDDILEAIGLTDCKYTKCGSLSGGQKKRLSIALELVDNPPIMFLDEPTTGLDSSYTSQLVSLLKSLSRGGRNIICTIHQPSATVLAMFDHVYVIGNGHCVYQGSSQNIVNFLQSINLPCPQYNNPSDYIMDLVAENVDGSRDKMIKASLTSNWRSPAPVINVDLKKVYSSEYDKSRNDGQNNSPSEILKMFILIQRCTILLFRDWTVTYLKMLMHFVVGILMGLLFNGVGNNGEMSINNVGFFLCTSVYLSYTSIMPAILKFPSELKILKKEQFNNWYKLYTYYIAFTMTNIPVQIMLCSIYVTVSYIMTEQIMEWARFTMFMIFNMLAVVISEFIGLALGTSINPVNGLFGGSVLFCFMLLMGGFIALYKHMPIALYYVSYLSYLRYSMEGMVISIYGYERAPLTCSVTYCHYRIPQAILDELDMYEGKFWYDISSLFFMCAFFCIFAYCMLRRTVVSVR